jgi:hypothetical protein
MNSAESSYQQGVLTDEMEEKERPHLYEDSCGVAGHVNEDDEKLNTSITEEEDQRSVLIIGGIQIFLPNSPTEASTSVSHEEMMQQESKREAMGPNDFKTNCVYDAGATEERQPTRIVKEEEKEKTLMSSPTEKEEHSDEFLTQWKQEMKMLEDWLNNPEPEKDCQDAVMQRETGCQHEEKLEEAEDMPTREMTEVNLSEEEVEQQLSGETAELESATEWSTSAIGNEDDVGDQIDLSISKDETQ